MRFKVCKICGVEIINGENGCAMAGDVCFSCKPVRFDLAPPTRNDFGGMSWDAMDFLEGRCLSDT